MLRLRSERRRSVVAESHLCDQGNVRGDRPHRANRERELPQVGERLEQEEIDASLDQAFRLLAKDLTGKTIRSEKKIFEALVDLAGVDTIETVLLYHVVPGKTLTSPKVLKASGSKLTTAQGGKVKVKVRMKPSLSITLKDRDKNDQDPKVVLKALDLNKGNKQVAHGIDRVLRPIDL